MVHDLLLRRCFWCQFEREVMGMVALDALVMGEALPSVGIVVEMEEGIWWAKLKVVGVGEVRIADCSAGKAEHGMRRKVTLG